MRRSIKKGFGFGITSGIITTLGLIVGLYSGTHSKLVILGAILTIAIADAASDAFGIHISEEVSDKRIKDRELWESTASTFLFKFVFAIIFVIPFFLFELKSAIIFSVIFGIVLLSIFSYFISKQNGSNSFHVVLEHLIISILVITITYFVGLWVSTFS